MRFRFIWDHKGTIAINGGGGGILRGEPDFQVFCFCGFQGESEIFIWTVRGES